MRMGRRRRENNIMRNSLRKAMLRSNLRKIILSNPKRKHRTNPLQMSLQPQKMNSVLYTLVCSNDDHCCFGVSWYFTFQA